MPPRQVSRRTDSTPGGAAHAGAASGSSCRRRFSADNRLVGPGVVRAPQQAQQADLARSGRSSATGAGVTTPRTLTVRPPASIAAPMSATRLRAGPVNPSCTRRQKAISSAAVPAGTGGRSKAVSAPMSRAFCSPSGIGSRVILDTQVASAQARCAVRRPIERVRPPARSPALPGAGPDLVVDPFGQLAQPGRHAGQLRVRESRYGGRPYRRGRPVFKGIFSMLYERAIPPAVSNPARPTPPPSMASMACGSEVGRRQQRLRHT